MHRKDVYQSYIPATLPPLYYHGNGAEPGNPGFTDGVFRYNQENDLGTTSVFSLVFHEFGHSLGVVHRPATIEQCAEWYWGRADTLPVVDNNIFADLPEAYIGGGTYDTVTGTLSNLPSVEPRGDHPLAQTHMNGAPFDCSKMAPGLPNPPYAAYNNRVVFPDDVARLPAELLQIEYPIVRDTIIMVNKSGTDTLRSNDWSEVLDKTGMLLHHPADPYFVVDIIEGGA